MKHIIIIIFIFNSNFILFLLFLQVYIEDALNERWWVDCSWCKCLVENIVTAFGTKQPAPHLIPTDNNLGTF